MVTIMMLVTKARRELRALHLINSCGLESMKMSTEQSKTVDGISFMEGGREERAPMVLMMVTAPLQLVHLDFISFEMTTNLNKSPKVKHILVIVDHL